jgi:peptidoglycan-associated lipoprotein
MKRNNRILPTTLATLTALALVACADERKPPRTTKAPTQRMFVEAEPIAPAQDDGDTESAIDVDDEIARVCDLPAAHFAFDSSKVTQSAAAALDALSECFSSGPLAGRSMKIVGHADPRGGLDYNLALGQRRAGSVAEYLEHNGLQQARIVTTSMGELESTGTDEAGWARDRKVEILLAERAFVPQKDESPYSQFDVQ